MPHSQAPHAAPPPPSLPCVSLVQFVLSSELEEIPKVQEAVEVALVSHQYRGRDVFAVRLALQEALSNAILHGNGLDASKQVWVYCRVSSQRVEVLVTDEGEGFDFPRLLDPTAPDDAGETRGCGLLLMRYYMDEVLFEPPGNTVRLIKRRPPPLGAMAPTGGES